MGTYTIGVGQNYLDFSAAEASLGGTLPEAGGTIYQTTGNISEVGDAKSFGALYLNGLTIEAQIGSEADGAKGGSKLDFVLTTAVDGCLISKLNLKRFVAFSTGGFVYNLTDCDIGDGIIGGTLDAVTSAAGSSVVLNNCIIRGDIEDGTSSSDTPSYTANECTVVDAGRYGFIRGLTTNCLSIGATTGDFLPGEGSFNASSDLTAIDVPYTNGITGRTTADFNNYATGDFNLAPASSLNTSGSTGGPIGAILAVASGSTPINTIINNLLSGNGSI